MSNNNNVILRGNSAQTFGKMSDFLTEEDMLVMKAVAFKNVKSVLDGDIKAINQVLGAAKRSM